MLKEKSTLNQILGNHTGRPMDQIEAETEQFRIPGLSRRDGRWIHEGEFAGAGGRHGRHSEDFDPLWDEMTKLYREHPGASW